jgi:2-oxoglutarate ferredoxin oxidoreductase subunit beta
MSLETTPLIVGGREVAAIKVANFLPDLLLTQEHALCPGCGEPVALRILLDTINQLGMAQRAIGAIGIGCYTMFSSGLDVDVVQALHGRAPSVATGVKRMLPDSIVFTVQGDGDMVSEGLQEIIHSAARGENITCIMLNNGVFGETGGQMTAATVVGQRTKNTIEGRTVEEHGHPIQLSDLIKDMDGVAYVARGAVNNQRNITATKRMIRHALEVQDRKEGFSLVEILVMCPTGWFVGTEQGPEYMDQTLAQVHTPGVLRGLDDDVAHS